MKEALLVIDMLNDFVREGAQLEVPDARSIIPVIKQEIDTAHAVANPVNYVCDGHTAVSMVRAIILSHFFFISLSPDAMRGSGTRAFSA
jgi:nicotinamidase-related amidase